MKEKPALLRIPTYCRSVEEVLGVAQQMNLSNVVLISERDNGNVVFMSTSMSVATANWLVDRAKQLVLRQIDDK